MPRILLGVNIDHIATLRNIRNTKYPDPIQAAFIAEQAGADSITIHLREDRRHISNRDIHILRQTLNTRMNLEMAITEEMLDLACEIKPYSCCLVPEKRQELTTERGLNIVEQYNKIHNACKRLTDSGIQVSLFVDAENRQIEAAAKTNSSYIEIHTGCYANAKNEDQRANELANIINASSIANECGLKVNAGHGLNYYNVQEIAAISEIYELNIGHSIICRAIINGLKEAVIEMKRIILKARQ